MKRKVFILRGLPGSGKSTWAVYKLEEYTDMFTRPVIRSADDYFLTKDGYKFDPTKLQDAHNDNLLAVVRYISQGYDHPTKEERYHQFDIIIDNTNTTALEIAPYLRVAQAFGWDVEIVYFPCTVGWSILRNTHNVPEHVIRRMDNNLQIPLPKHWEEFVVTVDPTWFAERSIRHAEGKDY